MQSQTGKLNNSTSTDANNSLPKAEENKEATRQTKIFTNVDNTAKLALAVSLFKAERQDLIEKCLSKAGIDPNNAGQIQAFELKLAASSGRELQIAPNSIDV